MKITNGTNAFGSARQVGSSGVTATGEFDRLVNQAPPDKGTSGPSFPEANEEDGLSSVPKSPTSVVDEFLKWAHMSPSERLRAQYLANHGMSETSVGALPEDQRQALEVEIKRQIEQQLAEQRSGAQAM